LLLAIDQKSSESSSSKRRHRVAAWMTAETLTFSDLFISARFLFASLVV
jgi:hypothetical protein